MYHMTLYLTISVFFCQPVPPTQIMQAINLNLFYSFVRLIKNMSKYDKSELKLIPTTFGN